VPQEPSSKRAIVFIDGQNLFHAARKAFGYTYPNFDPLKLATALCNQCGWNLQQVRFYTGIPDVDENAAWHHFWSAKKLAMLRSGIYVYTRPLRYRNKVIRLSDGSMHTALVGEEKGIDVRLALDIIMLGHKRTYDVAFVLKLQTNCASSRGNSSAGSGLPLLFPIAQQSSTRA